MRSLDTPEIHGYRPDLGYRVYTGKALEIAAAARPEPPDPQEGQAAALLASPSSASQLK